MNGSRIEGVALQMAGLKGAAFGESAGSPVGVLSGNGQAGLQPAAATDITAFQRALGSPAANGANPVNAVSKSAPTDLMAQGIREAAASYNSRFDALRQGLNRVEKDQSIASLLQYQLESAKMGVEMEMTGKIVSKVVQDVEQLTKQQG